MCPGRTAAAVLVYLLIYILSEGIAMQTAKLFANGRSQAVRLPAAFRLEGDTVYIRRDENGGVVLSAKPADWQGFIDTCHIRSRMRRITGNLRLPRSSRGAVCLLWIC